ncbi:hypothetical protein [Lacipirellula sp.]|uniref:hypothetical protein n=1 Tax=Lacipirellula sp. TaxID=2691419 RepID=UPI003D0B0189
MNRFTLYAAATAFIAAAGPALAGTMSFAGNGMGGGHRHGGRGPGAPSIDAIQSDFEDQFADITSAYDDGVADSEDYYSTDAYADLVGETEWLVDRYDWFVAGVERTIGHIDDYLASANDDLAFYDDLLADYEARDDLSETRLARIVDWITTAQDMISLQIATLTYKQTTLEENLATYTTFQSGLTSYLDEIVTAGGGSVTTGNESEGGSALMLRLAATAGDGCAAPMPVTPVATAVPEPSAAALTAILLTLGGWRAMRRPHNQG